MEGKSNKKKTTIQFTEELNKINSDIEWFLGSILMQIQELAVDV